MKKFRRFGSVLTVLAVLLSLFGFSGVAMADGMTRPDPEQMAPNGSMEEFTPDGQAAFRAIPMPCAFRTRTDRPHMSSTSTRPAVQVHAWWELVACTSPNWRATVKAGLLKKVNGKWVDVGSQAIGRHRRPGPGTANRVTAHYDCRPSKSKSEYMAWADVDIEGARDPATVYKSESVWLPCS